MQVILVAIVTVIATLLIFKRKVPELYWLFLFLQMVKEKAVAKQIQFHVFI